MEFSGQQAQALDSVGRWLKVVSKPQPAGEPGEVYYLAGYGGTGKTTLAIHLASSVSMPVFAAFTGKAASVMRRKGCWDASTIHSLIYTPVEDPTTRKTTFVLNANSAASTAGLIVVDEVSMVNEQVGRDLLSFGRPVLVLGDPAQLPPVSGTGFFTANKPDFLLTEIHRQALENPIIRVSMDVREGRGLRLGDYGELKVIERRDVNAGMVLDADQVLVGRNKTREQYNRRIRQLLKRAGDLPEPGDRLVCLRNNKETAMLNGVIHDVVSSDFLIKQKLDMKSGKMVEKVDEQTLQMLLREEDVGDKRWVRTRVNWFQGEAPDRNDKSTWGYDHFDYGYALTVHKSQGSQWDNVMLFDESDAFRENAVNHLYTAITRAAKTLIVVTGN